MLGRMANLEKQTIIITGASSGIGRATARMLREAGMRLVVTGRRGDRLDELVSELGEEHAAPLAGDVLDPDLPARLIDLAVERFGRCDAVFNNAGVLEVQPLDEIDIDRVCQMVRINVEAAYRMAYVAVRYFQTKNNNRGTLINTSSILGTKSRPTGGWYAGTKFAIEALSEALRIELAGTDIHIAAIEPGLVRTELHRTWEEPSHQRLNIEKPLEPEDIARSVRFILESPPHVRIPRLMILPGEHAI